MKKKVNEFVQALKTPRSFLVPGTVLLISCLYVLGSARSFPPTKAADTIGRIEILCESISTLFSFLCLFMLSLLRRRNRIFRLLLTGTIIFYFSQLQDLLDEFFLPPVWAAMVENVGFPTGIIFVSIGWYLWAKLQLRLIGELRRVKEGYKQLSLRDELTGLYNSRQLFQQLPGELGRAGRYGRDFSLLALDLDNFKAYNDRYGHLEGDEVIRRMAEVLRNNLREADTAFRYGGEEFFVFLPEVREEGAAAMAERICREFHRESFRPEGETVHGSVSIGVTQFRREDTEKSILRRADQAMYRAKARGKNRVCTN